MGSSVGRAAWGSVLRGWPFPRKDSSCLVSLLSFASGLALSLGTRRGTQVPAHPNNVRPLARSGLVSQCLASPAQSPAGSPPHSPQAPLNFGRVRSTALGTLAAGSSPPPPRVEVKYRGPGFGGGGGQRHGPDLHFQPGAGAGALLGIQPASPQQAQSRSPSCACPRSNQGPSIPPVPQSPSLQSSSLGLPGHGAKPVGEQTSRRAGKQASKQAVALCICVPRVCVLVCVPACPPVCRP